MQIPKISNRIAMTAATVAATAGVSAGICALTSCSETASAIKEYPEITSGSPDFIEAKEQALYWAKQDPDIQHNCLGKPIRLLGNDTSFVCKNGNIIYIYPTTATKEVISPKKDSTTYLLEDVAAAAKKINIIK